MLIRALLREEIGLSAHIPKTLTCSTIFFVTSTPGIIVLETSSELFEPTNNAPKAVDVHLISAAADRFLLRDLRRKAGLFLMKTCTIDNVTSRLFGISDGVDSSGAAEYYEFFFKDNLEAILRSSDYKDFFQEVEGWSPTERAEVNDRFRKLTTDRLTETEEESAARKRRRFLSVKG